MAESQSTRSMRSYIECDALCSRNIKSSLTLLNDLNAELLFN